LIFNQQIDYTTAATVGGRSSSGGGRGTLRLTPTGDQK